MVIFKLKFLNTDNKHWVKHFTWNFIFTCTAFDLHYNPMRVSSLEKTKAERSHGEHCCVCSLSAGFASVPSLTSLDCHACCLFQ